MKTEQSDNSNTKDSLAIQWKDLGWRISHLKVAFQRVSIYLGVTTLLGLVTGLGKYWERLEEHSLLFMLQIIRTKLRAALHREWGCLEIYQALKEAERLVENCIDLQKTKIRCLSE